MRRGIDHPGREGVRVYPSQDERVAIAMTARSRMKSLQIMKKVMIIEDLRTPSIFGRDLRRPEAVVTLGCTMRFDIDVNMWNFSRGCFVQVIQQYLAVRQWHKPQASKTRRQAWMSTSCAELEPLEYVWSPLCSFVRKIKYRCAHGCYSMEIV